MTFRIDVRPDGSSFAAEADEILLDAALRQGVLLPYGCRDGACGACRGRVLEGRVDHGSTPPDTLDDAARAAGWALFCSARPLSDLTIETRSPLPTQHFPVRTLRARIESLEPAAPDVMIVRLKLPGGERLPYLAGQYVDVLIDPDRRRSFSLAGAPDGDPVLELHVRRVPGGRFSEQLFTELRPRDLLRIRGPLGAFFLREPAAGTASPPPLLLVAGGTGFAPIKAIVEQALISGSRRPMTIYWGGRRRIDLYRLDLAERWAAEHAHLRFVPVLSDSPPVEGWRGRTGLVHLAALQDHPDLSACQAYVCGAPAMVAAARHDFIARGGLREEEFFADAFEFSRDAGIIEPDAAS